MKIILPLLLILLCACSNSSKNTNALINSELIDAGTGSAIIRYQITPWKFNAKGAYAIIFDDYCFDEAHGIQDYAAPEADQRGIRIGFGVVAGSCNDDEWAKARGMIANGHEIINHSYSHRCGTLQAPWCTDTWRDSEVTQEIDQAQKAIIENTGTKPDFFIFPFDLHTPKKIQHLKEYGYIGTRGGFKQMLNPADFDDPFALNFDVKYPPENLDMQGYSLNAFVDLAIAKGGMAFREVHGVEDQSWGSTPLKNIRDHFDYVQEKNKTYQLWTDTISTIIRYREARKYCQLNTGIDNGVHWARLTGDKKLCPANNEVSLLAQKQSAKNIAFIDPEGTAAPVINSTHLLKTGVTYTVR